MPTEPGVQRESAEIQDMSPILDHTKANAKKSR